MFEPCVAGIPVDEASTGDLLRLARDRQRDAHEAEADLLALAFQWALTHPALDGRPAAFHHGPDIDPTPVVGEGCPAISEYAVAEFGAVLAMSTTSAKRLIGHAIELHLRLPRLWSHVRSGRVPAWRARSVAEATIHADPSLSPEAVDWIDRQVGAVAGKVSKAQLDRLVADAIERHHLAQPDPVEHVDARGVWVDSDHIDFTGTVHVEATLSAADALDLDHAVRLGAERLADLGSSDPLPVRRANALGHLCRRQLSLDLTADPDGTNGTNGTSTGTGTRPRPARRLDLHLHLTAAALGTHDAAGRLDVRPTVTLDEGQRLLLLEQVRAWAADEFTEVRVLPILDLAESLRTHTYEPSPRLRRQVELRDTTCAFPYCTRPARLCDLDHVQPYGAGQGSTTSENLAPLCRSHHRLKTHTGWTYGADPHAQPGTWLWTSPHGHTFRRDRTGTEPTGPSG